MYKAILFDLDGTLIDFEACVTSAARETFRDAGFEVDDAASWARIWEMYAPISASYWSRCAEEGWSSEQVTTFTMRDTLAALGADERRAPDLAEAYWSAFCRTAYLNPGARETLERLAPYYVLGLVTNGDSDAQRGRLEAAGLTGYFQSIVISGEVGVAKPAREIFQLVLSELGVAAREALYVGDSIAHDYYGTQRAGIDFCWVQRDDETPDEVRPRSSIHDLRDLIHVLGLTGHRIE